jgi:hypothetical protein
MTYHHIVDPNVRAGDIDTIRTTDIRPTDGDVIDLSGIRVVDDDMELGRIDEDEVVERPVIRGDDTHEAGTMNGSLEPDVQPYEEELTLHSGTDNHYPENHQRSWPSKTRSHSRSGRQSYAHLSSLKR